MFPNILCASNEILDAHVLAPAQQTTTLQILGMENTFEILKWLFEKVVKCIFEQKTNLAYFRDSEIADGKIKLGMKNKFYEIL